MSSFGTGQVFPATNECQSLSKQARFGAGFGTIAAVKRRLPTRLGLPVSLLALAALSPAAAPAAPPPIHELSASGSAVAAPLAVPARPPRRLPDGSGASASSLRVADATELGTRTNGKILAVDPRDGHYTCSGTAIDTPSRSIVLTAGHCVIEHQSEGRQIVFVPAYDHGRRPFGTYPVESAYVMPEWRRGENPDFDVAALRVGPSQFGLLTDVVGARGYATSKSRLSAIQIFGYPAAHLRGEELRSCRAHGLGLDPLTDRFAGPPTMPAPCDMAAGSSGGAWLFDGEYVSGVTSYGYEGRPTQLFSPYFGAAIGSFLQQLP
jgi:V8-like Glu-specific endopeptidase